MTAHAKLSASGSERWMSCPGSVQAEEGIADSQSPFAAEGTAAHDVAERALDTGSNADTYIGEIIEVGEFKVEVTAAMADYVQQYVDHVRALGGLQLYEKRVDFSHIVPEGFGTSDAIIIADRIMHVCDLKYGKGVKVYAKDNTQGLLYALGAVNDFGYLDEFDKITIHIIQPRLDHIDEWTIDRDTLTKFAAYAKMKAEDALRPNAPRYPTEKGCVFCKAKHQCPELKRHTESLLITQFDDLDTIESLSTDKLTHEQMSEILKNKKLITTFLDAIETYAIKQFEDGASFPGFKMVAGRSNRKISDEEFAVRMLEQNGYKAEQVYKPKQLKTITELEKLMGKKEFALVLGDVVVKPEGAPTLAQESDPRPAVTFGGDLSEFENIS